LNDQQPVLIAGASVRAAAHAAVHQATGNASAQAGWQVYSIDLFGDADLRAVSKHRVVPACDYPDGIIELARTLPAAPWVYTGAIENHPAVIEAVSAARPLWGNPASVVRPVRDPVRLQAALKRNGLKCPDVVTSGLDGRDGSWMSKPLKSAAGGSITRIHAAQYSRAGHQRGFYYQQYIEGETQSGAYVMAGGRAVLLGVTAQLSGGAFSAGGSYTYGGSLGPLCVPECVWSQWRSIGACLAREFNLQGLVGVDAIFQDDGGVYPLEVNPRYTASMELYDRAGRALFHDHVAACRDGILPPQHPPPPEQNIHGKAIVYAQHNATVTSAFTEYCCRRNAGPVAEIADIPVPGQQILRGQPVATVFANGGERGDVHRGLQVNCSALLGEFRRCDPLPQHRTGD